MHLVLEYKDSSDVIVIDYFTDVYAWYKAGVHQEIASVSGLTSTSGGSSQGGFYLEASSLGITEEEKNALRIFPNPANDFTSITLNEGQIVRNIVLTDLQGKKFTIDFKAIDNRIELNMQELSAGVYFVGLEMDNGRTQQGKLIKK